MGSKDYEELALSGPSGGFEELPHTADRAIRAWGETLSDLFVWAARGMYSLAGNPEVELRGGKEVTLEVEAASPEGLLVAWLNELLYLTETKKLLFRDFAVDGLLLPPGEEERRGWLEDRSAGKPDHPHLQPTGGGEITGQEGLAFLRGRARGTESLGPSLRYIKAATYHNLEIEKKNGFYVAEIVFDV